MLRADAVTKPAAVPGQLPSLLKTLTLGQGLAHAVSGCSKARRHAAPGKEKCLTLYARRIAAPSQLHQSTHSRCRAAMRRHRVRPDGRRWACTTISECMRTIEETAGVWHLLRILRSPNIFLPAAARQARTLCAAHAPPRCKQPPPEQRAQAHTTETRRTMAVVSFNIWEEPVPPPASFRTPCRPCHSTGPCPCPPPP
jgi:hypothetical protein